MMAYWRKTMSKKEVVELPTRKLVDEETLQGIINQALGENEATSKVEVVGSIRPCDELYDDGGNWKRSIALGGSPIDPQRCGEVAADIIEQIAKNYNLTTGN